MLLGEQADQILTATDPIAERVRKLGGTTLRSIGHLSRLQRLADNNSDCPAPLDMLAELCDDNLQLAAHMREAHGICEEHGVVATASLMESWIDEAEGRVWFLSEARRIGREAGGLEPEGARGGVFLVQAAIPNESNEQGIP